MQTINATRFRADLFRTLKSVATGSTVRISSKWGNAVLIHESKLSGAAIKHTSQPTLDAEIPGLIIGSLDNADQALRDHIRIPS